MARVLGLLIAMLVVLGISAQQSADPVWCRYSNSFLWSYAGPSFTNLEDAQKACLKNSRCNGITQEPYNKNRYTQRVGPQIQSWSPTGETSWAPCPSAANWCEYTNSFLYSYAGPSFSNLEDAQKACLRNRRCNGITQEPYNNNRYTQRVGPRIHNTSPTGETSWAVCPAVEHTSWCTYTNSFLYSYAGPSFSNLEDAQNACLRNKRCNGITQEPYNNNRYTQRIGPTIHNTSPTGETSWAACPTAAKWCRYTNSFLYSYAGPSYNDLQDAQNACLRNTRCNGITQEPYNNNRYTQRVGPTIHNTSPTRETSWVVC